MSKFKKIKRILVLTLAIAVVFCGLPSSALTGAGGAKLAGLGTETASAATSSTISGSLGSKRLNRYDFKTSIYMQIYFVDYVTGKLLDDRSCTEASARMHVYNINTGKAVNPVVFCVEHGVMQRNTTNMKAKSRDSSMITSAYKKAGKSYVIDNIFNVLYFAPTTSSPAELAELGFAPGNKYYGKNASSYTFGDWVAATQMLVWECQQDFRDEDFNRRANGLYYQTGFNGSATSKIPASHYTQNIKGTAAMDIYNFIESAVKQNMKFDKKIASTSKNSPKEIIIEENATFPYTKVIPGSSTGESLEVVDDNGKKVDGISITFDESTKKYTLTVEDKSLLNKTLAVRHNGKAAARAKKYTEGENSKYYKPVFWEYATSDGSHHTQGFASGLDDRNRGYIKLTQGTEEITTLVTCEPPEAEVFPILNMPIEKIDANSGFDGNTHTPMGDAKLDAVATLSRQINGGAWETVDTKQFDEYGTQIVFSDQPFTDSADLNDFLTESGSLTTCDHPIYGEKGAIIGYEHSGSKSPTKKVWDVTVNYKITITRPDGRYINPDAYGGVREYQFKYHAESEDTCKYWCHDDPWEAVTYTLDWSTTTGDGSAHNLTGTSTEDGGTINSEEELTFDAETDVEDTFRGSVLLIKSNEKENAFKDSALGGSTLSKESLWTVRLKSKGYEGSEYVHLVSATPKKGALGVNIYTVSRSPGIVNDVNNPMKVGTSGQLLIRDLPYGEYVISEVSADDPMYVLEEFTVVVSEHNGSGTGKRVAYESYGGVKSTGSWDGYDDAGENNGIAVTGTGDLYNNLYQVNVRDQVKTNRIKLEKVDSETGKIVRLAGTKVFIRYKGNPDYSDTVNKERYGTFGTVAKNIYNRFLPNAEAIDSKSTNYTFKLDENGCFDIPYELPYGKYEIYEWLLPDGYYVGEYDASGVASNHNFGLISEGQFTVDADTDGFGGTVPSYAIKDASGKPIKYQDASEYSFENLTEMVTNRYTFTVTKQGIHTDGNFSELVTYDGKTFDADPSYDKGDYPYNSYYKVAAVINNAVKGKITIEKEGESLTGFKKETKDGKSIFTPIYEMGAKLKDAVFGIFAGEDINLSDGSEGPRIYDSATGEEIVIPTTTSSHLNNAVEAVKAFVGKLLNPKSYSASNYETGELSHESGAELWYMLEREVSEDNMKRTIYVTPEQKDTVYSYTYEVTEGEYKYQYTVNVTMRNQAGGNNITDVVVTKITMANDGYEVEIPTTQMTGTVGGTILNPVGNFINMPEGSGTEVDPNLISALDSVAKTYVYEADGDYSLDWDDSMRDFSNVGVSRHVVKNYHYYELTADDLTDVEKVVQEAIPAVEGYDANGDDDFDDPGDTPPVAEVPAVTQTKKKIEWANEGWELVGSPAVGGKAIFKKTDASATESSYKVAVIGYDAAITAADKTTEEKVGTVRYTNLLSGDAKYVFLESDASGSEIFNYTLPEGYSEVAFAGNPETEARYIIASKYDEDAGLTSYQVLLANGTWQECDVNGNFQKAVVQIYEVNYTQVAGDPSGFTLNWDGFALGSNVDVDTNTAKTIITKHSENVTENFEIGAGYTYENVGDTVTFTTIPIDAPIYFKWADGVTADMYYKGGVAYATITLPQSAVDYLYEDIVPTLSFNYKDGNGKDACMNLDWYSGLTPENPEVEFSVVQGLPEGCTVKATKKEAITKDGEASYLIEIVTNQTEEKPLRLTFADGYVMDVYTAVAASAAGADSGNGVGVIDLYNVYKTTRYTKGELVDTITTDENGYAESKLLPLGEYIVRELDAPDGYVTSDNSYEVELKYKDQFTPLVWNGLSLKNEYFTVEIDLEKVFETAYGSGTYESTDGAKFGLYSAQTITAKSGASSAGSSGLVTSIPENSLLDVITVDENGKAKSKIKLPYGIYYIQEISTKNGYVLNDLPFYFVVGEDSSTTSVPCVVGYDANGEAIEAEDGVGFKIVLDSYGSGTIKIETQARTPMPGITIDGIEYSLSTSQNLEDIEIETGKDISTATITANDNVTRNITLPNGKALSVTVTGNTYAYTYEGNTVTFVPTTSYTGYAARYASEFEPSLGEDLNVKTQEITVTEAVDDPNKVTINVVHTPVTKEVIITPAVAADDKNGNGIIETDLGETEAVAEVTKTVGVLDANGYQTYMHTASFKFSDSIGAAAIKENAVTRTRNGESATESATAEAIEMLAGDTISFLSSTDASFTLSLDADGVLNVAIADTLAGALTEANKVKATVDGIDKTEDVVFAKNVTQARQNHAAKTLQVKVNTLDNVAASGIENDAVKPDTPYVPSNPSKPNNPGGEIEDPIILPTPEEPTEPEPVEEPKTPTKKTTKKEAQTEVPKTGDGMGMFPFLVVMLGSASAFCALTFRPKRKNKRI